MAPVEGKKGFSWSNIAVGSVMNLFEGQCCSTLDLLF